MEYTGRITPIEHIVEQEYITKETAELLLTGVDLPEDRNAYIALVNKRIQETKSEVGTCDTCARRSEYVFKRTGVNTTHCPIEAYCGLPKRGFCHLYASTSKKKSK